MLAHSFLISLGWDDFFQSGFDKVAGPDMHPARIIGQGRGHYHIQFAPEAVLEAEITSVLHHACKISDDFPAVGDWVAFSPGQGRHKASIHHVLPRKTSLRRKRSGSDKSQHIVTNVESILIVTSMSDEFDLPRLGRYLDIGNDSGAMSTFILTKADLCPNPEIYLNQLKSEFKGVEIFPISAADIQSMQSLERFFSPGMTAVLLGSSGVGKSALTNYLQGAQVQKTGGLSGESRGKHTTTSRNLIATRWGGWVIDTPGMQEIAAKDGDQRDRNYFPEIEALTLQCKFTNCRHQADPGCAVTAALKSGALSTESWAAFNKAARKATNPKRTRY
jgi:ribosome biogenesis GTPase